MKEKLFKKILSVALSVLMVGGTAAALPVMIDNSSMVVSAAETYGDFEYEVNSDNTVTITRYIGNGGDVTIPSSIDGKNVAEIGDYSFSDLHYVASVTIPDSVTSIGNGTFYNCWELTCINIPNSVTSIGESAFSASGLKKIIIPNNVMSIGDGALKNCWQLTDITVSSNNDHYSSQDAILFNKDKTVLIVCPECKAGSYTIPNSVMSIESYAFCGCEKLTNIIIPNSVTRICNNAFESCMSLSYVTIPDSVTYLGEMVFQCCLNLTNITLSSSLTCIYADTFWECRKLTSITIPDSVTVIGKGAFNGSKLTSIFIPDSVIVIGECAFGFDTPLKNVYYSGTKEQWNGISIDSDNDSLKNATIHYNVKDEEDYQKKFTKAHVDYLDDVLMNRITNDWLGYCVSGKIMGMEEYQKIKNDYNKWRLATGEYFENPYDAVVGELIYSDASANAWDNLANANILKSQRSILKSIVKVIDFGGYDFTEEEFINNYTKYLKGDVPDSNVEKILERIFDENEDEIKAELKAFDKIGKGLKYFENGQKVIKAARKVIKYCSAVNAYYDSEEEFKQLLIKLADESLLEYNRTKNIEYLLLHKSLSEYTTVTTEKDIVDRVVQKALEDAIFTIGDHIKDATKEKINQWLIKKMAAKIGQAAATNAGSFLLGCTIGKTVGIMFMNGVFHLSDASDEYIKAYYEAQMAELFKSVLAKSADDLKSQQTYEKAVVFHQAMQIYKGMELKVIDTLLQWYDLVYGNEEREFAIALGTDSATGKIIGKPNEEKLDPRYKLQICQVNWNYIRCPVDFDDSNNHYLVNPSEIPANATPMVLNVCCPVNVIVKNNSGKTLVKIVNDEIIEKADNVSAIIDHRAKIILIMGEEDYAINIEAISNGKMDYNITKLDSDFQIKSLVSYENITLEKGTQYSGNILSNTQESAKEQALKTTDGTVECTIHEADQSSYVPVSAIKLSKGETLLKAGQKKAVSAIVSPDNATIQSVIWQSSDEKIATVDGGLITAKSSGTATITAKTSNGSITSSCTVNVFANTSTVSSKTIPKGKSIVVNANADGGLGNYEYAVWYKQKTQSKWKCAQKYSTIKKVTITPKYAKKYLIRVNAKDASGLISKKDFSITVYPKLKNTSTLSATTITKGKSVTVNASSTGGIGTKKYAVYYKKASSAKYTRVKAFSAVNTAAVKPSATGTYNIRVKVKDKTGKVVKKDFTVKVTKPLTNTAKLSAASLKLGSSLTVTASATGGTGGYKYAVYYKKASSGKWITAQAFKTNTTVRIKPSSAVKYDICVKVKDSSGRIAKKYMTVKVTKPLKNNSAISALTVKKGSAVKVTAKAAGGTGKYTYAVYYKKAASEKWITAQAFKANTTVRIKPSSAVKYDICVKVKDSSGSIAKKYFKLKVTK